MWRASRPRLRGWARCGRRSNAGNMVRGTPLDSTPEQFEATWRGSTYAGFLFARAALPRLLAAGGGSLLFTGASASVRGRGPFAAFAAAKAGLRSLAQSCAREYGPQGVPCGAHRDRRRHRRKAITRERSTARGRCGSGQSLGAGGDRRDLLAAASAAPQRLDARTRPAAVSGDFLSQRRQSAAWGTGNVLTRQRAR